MPGLRLVIADGASGDGSSEIIQAWIDANKYAAWISVLPLTANGGFGWAHNQLMLRALRSNNPPDFIYLLNPDTRIEPGAILALREAFDKDPRIACAGSQLINQAGEHQPAGFRLPGVRTEFARGARAPSLARALFARNTVIEPQSTIQEVHAVSGASFMVRCAALHDTGLFDHGFFLYFEELEWMFRFRRHGWKIVHEPASRVHHIGGAATKLSRDRDELSRTSRPFYWYQSQRRCLYRTLGPLRAKLAGIAWFLGFGAIAIPLSAISGRFRSRLIKNEARDMIQAWQSPDRFERRAFIAFPGDPIDQPPAWLNRPN